MTQRTWALTIGALVALRIAIPLAVLAASGDALPGLPNWRYVTFAGDANGFYAAAREAISAAGRLEPAEFVLVAVIGVIAGWATRRFLRGPSARCWLAIVVPAAALSLTLTLIVREMSAPGAAVVGWSLVWGAALTPYRLLTPPGADVAFALGLALSLAAVAATTIATAFLGLYATGRRAVGLAAAGLYAVWPLLTGPLTGERAWENGQWSIDVGLHLYTEPLSTALVTVAVALLLRPSSGDTSRAASGVALGFSTVVKLSNGLIGAALAPLVAIRHGIRAAIPLCVGGLVWLPLLLAYWPKGYVALFDGDISANEHPWGLDYADDAWTDSLLFTPVVLLVLAPGLLLGIVAVSDRITLGFLLAPVAVTALVYSFYDVTALHPRFLYVTLPFVFVLEAAGAFRALQMLRRRQPLPNAARRSASASSTR